MRADPLRRDLCGRLDLEAERVAVERERLLQVADGDTDVIQRDTCWRGLQAARLRTARLEIARQLVPKRSTADVVDYGIRIRLARRDAIEQPLELSRGQHAVLHVLDEAVRHQLADAELGAGAAPLAERRGGVRLEAIDRLDQLGHPLAGGRFRLDDRRAP